MGFMPMLCSIVSLFLSLFIIYALLSYIHGEFYWMYLLIVVVLREFGSLVIQVRSFNIFLLGS